MTPLRMRAYEQTHKFPPFPAPPDGVAIVPLSTFAPVGYRWETVASGETIEVDAWVGMPTVKVLNEEESVKKRKAKKRRRNAGNAVDAEGKPIPWWEEWEEGEEKRTTHETSFHSGMSAEDRVCLAADDFRVGRTWPEIAHGVRYMWDQFRLYIGLISSIPVYKKIKKQRGQVDGPNNGDNASEEEDDTPKVTQAKSVIVQDYLEPSALPGKRLEPSPDESTVEGQRLRAFVDDMEHTVKVFLSSYMRDKGLIWTEKNLFIAPTILHFFLRFMLRNKVFSDSKEHIENLERALAVAEAARKELPLTAKHGQILPGQFDLGCKECWGVQGSLSVQISGTASPPVIDANEAPLSSDISSTFETELKQRDIEIVPSDVVLDSVTARQVMEDNLDTDSQTPMTSIPMAADPWTAAISAEEYTTASWTDVTVPSLMPLLGPSVFPLMMTTGIVEFSTRRIREVIPPGCNAHEDRVHTSVVEEVLADKFFRVVLGPWVGSMAEETPDFPRPVIVPGSRGAIAPEAMPDGFIDDNVADPWNPYRDDVTILVDGVDAAEQLVVGMGLCGTWVQIVPEGEDKRHPRACYWYIESLVASFPSYYTEGEMIGEVQGEEDEED